MKRSKRRVAVTTRTRRVRVTSPRQRKLDPKSVAKALGAEPMLKSGQVSMIRRSDFGPRNEAEKKIFAIEQSRVDMQALLYDAMVRSGTTSRKLAQRLNTSVAKVQALFSAQGNPSLVTLARAMYACGFQLRLASVSK